MKKFLKSSINFKLQFDFTNFFVYLWDRWEHSKWYLCWRKDFSGRKRLLNVPVIAIAVGRTWAISTNFCASSVITRKLYFLEQITELVSELVTLDLRMKELDDGEGVIKRQVRAVTQPITCLRQQYVHKPGIQLRSYRHPHISPELLWSTVHCQRQKSNNRRKEISQVKSLISVPTDNVFNSCVVYT